VEEIDNGDWTKCEEIIKVRQQMRRLIRNDRNGWLDQECAKIME
jgi:hypothetical protein